MECNCERTKIRTEEQQRLLINRLSRIEGQIRGIKGMVQKNAYCTDIIVQVAAANAALNSFNKLLLEDHIKGCVVDDIKSDKTETVDDLLNIIQKLMK
ncbi:MAG: metal-sensing transcriptional repressor [Clostridiales bacterium]|nr:metal-sensing transcriptional repressor [Clostridiales bacterium]